MIKAVFAVDHWGSMGYKGTLPWPHCSDDLQQFKKLTDGHVVVMGRKTYDDPKMPKPLPNRTTYVVTHRPIKESHAYTIGGDLTSQIQRLAEFHPKKTIWVIGGPQILMELKPLIEWAHITHFKGQFNSDVQIELVRFLRGFRTTSVKPNLANQLSWVTYKNIDI